MEYYMDDEKWNNYNTHSSSSYSSSQYPVTTSNNKPCPSMSRSVSTRSPLQKSFSQKNPFGLSRSASQKSSTKKSSLSRSSSHKCSEFTRKCNNLAKEQKAKFYIVKRCISMLVGWKKNRSSDS